ncbi:MAG: diguanylate cyclase (GGDEF)-like protein [Granulosicoccus sp.]|jgi:diguanylate cyclase (GGDEF)-like protein
MRKERATILVVDEESINIQILNNALDDEYNILAATMGKQAIKVASQSLPDLILLDVMMPDINGHDVCQTLKSNDLTKHIPIIFVTAQSKPEDEIKGLELGAVDYFTKPFVLPLIKVRVRNQIDLIQKTAALERMAWIDGLTGISNRRLFDKRYFDACKYGIRNKRRISIILIDIDFFKQYNDHYGHANGDAVLKQVAQTLELGASRPLDLVARYGGEEFVILLTDASETEGAMVAEKVRAKVEALGIAHAESSIHKCLTISVGVTSSPRGVADFDHKALMEKADRCLYEAKSLGRNTVVYADFRPPIID